jgi:hypothetical protein
MTFAPWECRDTYRHEPLQRNISVGDTRWLCRTVDAVVC